MRNALFLCLNLLGAHHATIPEVLERNLEDWFERMLLMSDLVFTSPSPFFLDSSLEFTEFQIVSLLSKLFRYLGGRTRLPESYYLTRTDFSPLQNLILCCSAFGVGSSEPQEFGSWNNLDLRRKLSESKLFISISPDNAVVHFLCIPDVSTWAINLQGQLDLTPSNYGLVRTCTVFLLQSADSSKSSIQLLFHKFDALDHRLFVDFWYVILRHQVNNPALIGTSKDIFQALPDLRASENELLLLLIWSSSCNDRVRSIVTTWVLSREGDLQLPLLLCESVSSDEIALALGASLMLERLRRFSTSGNECPTLSQATNHLANLSLYLNGQPINDLEATLEHITCSYLRKITFTNIKERQGILCLLRHVLSPSNMEIEFDGIFDQYWMQRLSLGGSNHRMALALVLDNLQTAARSISGVLYVNEGVASTENSSTPGSSSEDELLEWTEDCQS